MKINEKSNTMNTEAVKAVVKEMQISPYATNAMRPLIIQKSLDGQRRAINLNQVEEAGLTKSTLDQWKYNCDSLYEAALDYSAAVKEASKKGASAEAQKAEAEAEQEVWNRWRTIISCGEKDMFHKNMFVRRKDVENLRVLAAESDELHIDGIGFIPSVKGKEAFRSKIEIRLACRIAGNETLNDDDRQTLVDMARAERQIDAASKVLDGYVKGKDVIPGVSAQITEAETKLDELKSTLVKAGVKDPDKFTASLVQKVNVLKDQKKAAEKKLKKATEAKDTLQKRYDEIIASLDSIEAI